MVTPSETPCAQCAGAGQVCVGEHVVTADMASDAGDPSMAGSHYGYEFGPCGACDGTGLAPAPTPPQPSCVGCGGNDQTLCPTCAEAERLCRRVIDECGLDPNDGDGCESGDPADGLVIAVRSAIVRAREQRADALQADLDECRRIARVRAKATGRTELQLIERMRHEIAWATHHDVNKASVMVSIADLRALVDQVDAARNQRSTPMPTVMDTVEHALKSGMTVTAEDYQRILAAKRADLEAPRCFNCGHTPTNTAAENCGVCGTVFNGRTWQRGDPATCDCSRCVVRRGRS